ncbi:MAG: DNA-directed DNA polymerase alpha subunit pol12 [Vezdaea aestivalis]|nr:MAG: DNA-directed DNA polymerase alpha subunit pol12 [Vezdaea aestivalis]
MSDEARQDIETHFSRFIDPDSPFPPDVLVELQSIQRQLSIEPYDLFLKWEAYSLKMGSEETKLVLETVRLFKEDLIESLPEQIRSKTSTRGVKTTNVGSTPRQMATTDDIYGMLDNLIPNTPRPPSTSTKRKAGLNTPATVVASTKATKGDFKTPNRPTSSTLNGTQSVAFTDRTNSGQIMEQLGTSIELPELPVAPFASSRLKLQLYTDVKKFSYRPMALHLSEASEILDNRITEFLDLLQDSPGFDPEALGDPCKRGTAPIITVGRIASDAASEKRLTEEGVLLETSMRVGAGFRIPIEFASNVRTEVFPGQIVALKGINASGAKFTVEEVVKLPELFSSASPIDALDVHNQRLRGEGDEDAMEIDSSNTLLATTTIIASGPYTADDNLDFEPLRVLIEKTQDLSADSLILTGPFLDIEHPLIASGDFDPPDGLDPDESTLTAIFKQLISGPLANLTAALPLLNLILIPSVRDACSQHVSWPQEQLAKKKLSLPRQSHCLPNPVTFSLNEVLFGISSQDIVNHLRLDLRAIPASARPMGDMPSRIIPHLISQRHFFPMFPPVPRDSLPRTGLDDGKGLATGPMLDTAYLKLGDWALGVKPDVLVLPSTIGAFAKIIQGVLTINPGSLSRRRGPGTYARLTVAPLVVTSEEREKGEDLPHRVFDRARVDIVRI